MIMCGETVLSTEYKVSCSRTEHHADFSPVVLLIFFHILFLREYWILTESRIPLKPVLGGMRIVVLSISSHE